MKTLARGIRSHKSVAASLFSTCVLIVALVAVMALVKAQYPKGSLTIRGIAKDEHRTITKTSASRKPNETINEVVDSAYIIRGDYRPGEKMAIPDANKISLEQAKSDPSIEFLLPKVLPNGAKLEAIFRNPNTPGEIIQLYSVDGKSLYVEERPMAEVPDFKKEAERGSVWVSPSNPDGTAMKNPDGSQKWVRMDNTTYITVNGLPGTANEPTEVSGTKLGVKAFRNPGIVTWYADGTLYTVKADMPVSELLKIAESME